MSNDGSGQLDNSVNFICLKLKIVTDESLDTVAFTRCMLFLGPDDLISQPNIEPSA